MKDNEFIGLAFRFTEVLAHDPEVREELFAANRPGVDQIKADAVTAQLVTRALNLSPPLDVRQMAEFKAGMRAVHAAFTPPPPWLELNVLSTYHSGGEAPSNPIGTNPKTNPTGGKTPPS